MLERRTLERSMRAHREQEKQHREPQCSGLPCWGLPRSEGQQWQELLPDLSAGLAEHWG